MLQFCLFVFGNERRQFCLVRSGHFCDLGTSLVKVKCGHGLNSTMGSNIFGVIDINLHGFNFRILGSKFFKNGSDELARSDEEDGSALSKIRDTLV
jgi:hypothetical protein